MKSFTDTNFLIESAKRGVDFSEAAFEEVDGVVEWMIPQEVLNELGSLKDRGMGKNRMYAKGAFEILSKVKPLVVELGRRGRNIDIMIVNYCLGKDIVVATMDKELKKRLGGRILSFMGKGKKIKVI